MWSYCSTRSKDICTVARRNPGIGDACYFLINGKGFTETWPIAKVQGTYMIHTWDCWVSTHVWQKETQMTSQKRSTDVSFPWRQGRICSMCSRIRSKSCTSCGSTDELWKLLPMTHSMFPNILSDTSFRTSTSRFHTCCLESGWDLWELCYTLLMLVIASCTRCFWTPFQE
jgi:hypothetical protein